MHAVWFLLFCLPHNSQPKVPTTLNLVSLPQDAWVSIIKVCRRIIMQRICCLHRTIFRLWNWILSSLHFYLPDMVTELRWIIVNDKVSVETCSIGDQWLQGGVMSGTSSGMEQCYMIPMSWIDALVAKRLAGRGPRWGWFTKHAAVLGTGERTSLSFGDLMTTHFVG